MNSLASVQDGSPAPLGRHSAAADATSVRVSAHVPALDGARGVAILLVLICHFASSLMAMGLSSPVLTAGRLGWCGVDVFFTLSGFLITGILLDTKAGPHYFRNFYARRVLRIFPLYYGAIAAVILLSLALPRAGWGDIWTPFGSRSLLWPGLFLQNAAILQGGPEITGALTHYWSLAVEEHFYLVWPLLVWLARSQRQVLGMAVAAGAFSIAARYAVTMHGIPANLVFALTPFRLDGLAMGAAAAVLVRSPARNVYVRAAPVALALAAAAFVSLIASRRMVEQTDEVLWLQAYPLVALGTASALVGSFRGRLMARALAISPLRWFGRYSYGLYVWHPLVNGLLYHSSYAIVHPGDSLRRMLALSAGILVFNLLVAWVSYHAFEKRFLDLKRYFAPASVKLPEPPAPEALQSVSLGEAPSARPT